MLIRCPWRGPRRAYTPLLGPGWAGQSSSPELEVRRRRGPARARARQDTFGVAAPGWLVQVDEEPVNTIDELLVAVRAGKFQGREWLRFRAIDSEGRPSVRALHPDGTFWPTVELVR
ncbi:unnamed protein product, partial [Prorocentrum cordatum]